MGHWVKRYIDNTSYIGTDEAVKKKEASWRNSRQIGIASVELEHDNHLMVIGGMGEFWQSDTFEVRISVSSPGIFTHRRIEKLVLPTDRFVKFNKTEHLCDVKFSSQQLADYKPMPTIWENRWFILEYDVRKKTFRYYIEDQKI